MPIEQKNESMQMVSLLTRDACAFCDAQQWQQVWERHADPRYNLIRCGACGLVRSEMIPDQKVLSGYYEEAYYETDDAKKFWGPIEWVASFFRYTRFRAVARGRRGSILDVGCGRGVMLDLFQRHGWKASGTEVSRNALRAARARGIHMWEGELPALALPAAAFDVVTMWHVLEHVREPRRYLEEVRRILKAGGLFVVEVPNFSSWAAERFQRNWFALEQPRHLWQFAAPVLRRQLESMGFTIIDERYASIDPGFFSLLQSVLNAIVGERNVLYDSIRTTEGRTRHSRSRIVASVLLAGVCALPLLMVMAFLVMRKKGDVVTWYAVKTEGEVRRG